MTDENEIVALSPLRVTTRFAGVQGSTTLAAISGTPAPDALMRQSSPK